MNNHVDTIEDTFIRPRSSTRLDRILTRDEVIEGWLPSDLSRGSSPELEPMIDCRDIPEIPEVDDLPIIELTVSSHDDLDRLFFAFSSLVLVTITSLVIV